MKLLRGPVELQPQILAFVVSRLHVLQDHDAGAGSAVIFRAFFVGQNESVV
jgi:hypothetical protein